MLRRISGVSSLPQAAHGRVVRWRSRGDQSVHSIAAAWVVSWSRAMDRGRRPGVRASMRDRRFVAAHRGGPLQRVDHVVLARWAADCAEQVLPLFTRHCDDDRPRRAIHTARSWADGSVTTGAAMKASVAAHAAARAAGDAAAVAAARASGHAVATAHAADHSMGALLYALKALEAAGLPSARELKSRLAKLPPHLRPQVSSGVEVRLKRLGIGRRPDA